MKPVATTHLSTSYRTAALSAWSAGDYESAANILFIALRHIAQDGVLDRPLLSAAHGLAEFADSHQLYEIAELLYTQLLDTVERLLTLPNLIACGEFQSSCLDLSTRKFLAPEGCE